MFIQPIYNILLLPDVTYFFKKDFFAGRADELEAGSDILFLFLKNEIADDIPASDAFYPVGYCRCAPLTAWRSVIRPLTMTESMFLLSCVLLSKIWEKTNSRQNSQNCAQPCYALFRVISGDCGRGGISCSAKI